MRKKWNIVVYRTIISILLLFNTMFFQIINTTVLAAGTAIDAKITQLQLLTDSGTPATEVAKSATIRMKFDFETPSTMMNKDDYFDIAIPKELDLTTAVTNPLTFDITDEGGNIVAKATISPTATSATTGGGTVRVTFNENANGKYNFKGNLFFDTKVNKKLVHDNETINIKTKVNNREDLTPDSKPVKINPDAALSKKEIIGKWGKSPTSPTVAAWGVRVNRTNQDLKNVVITDKITSNNGHFLDPSTMPAVKTTEQFKLLKVEYDAAGNVISWDGEVVDISDKITFNADKTEFRLELGDIGTQAYFLSYKSTVENGDIVQTNSAKITSDTFETQTSDGVWKYRSSGGSADGILAKRLKIRKVDIDTRVGLAGAKFLVTKPDGSTFQLETGTDGTILSQELIQGKYKVKEIAAPNGYDIDENEYTVQVFNDVGGTITVKDKSNKTTVKTTVKVKKEWVGPKGGPVTIHLLADGADTGSTVTLNNGNNWEDTFSNLAKYKADGTDIVYTVQEDLVTNYTSSVTGDATNGFTVTNTNNEKTTIKVKKEWVGPAAARVDVKLLVDGEERETLTLSAANHWKGEFEELYKYDPIDGHEIQYTVKEVAVEGYTSAVSGTVQTGFIITNTITGKVSVPVTKKWIGKEADSVTVHLYADGTDTGKSATLNAANQWQYTFANLEQYKDGKAINYTIKEDSITGYETKVTDDMKGYIVTNTNTEKLTIPVEKKWIGKEAAQVDVKLLVDGEEKETLTLNAANQWKGEFKNLYKYDQTDGHEIQYTVKEVSVEGYTSAISGTAQTGFTITNTKNPVPPTTPKTGDNSNLSLYIGVAVVALAIFGFVIVKRFKSSK